MPAVLAPESARSRGALAGVITHWRLPVGRLARRAGRVPREWKALSLSAVISVIHLGVVMGGHFLWLSVPAGGRILNVGGFPAGRM
jgi:hypothetical protein